MIGFGVFAEVFNFSPDVACKVLKRVPNWDQNVFGIMPSAVRELHCLTVCNCLKYVAPQCLFFGLDEHEKFCIGMTRFGKDLETICKYDSPENKCIEIAFDPYVVYQMLLILHLLWTQGSILHRDVKPSNILFDSDTRNVKLIDFGLARADCIHLYETKDPHFSGKVVALFFRHPCLLNKDQTVYTTRYGQEIDTWALGCSLWNISTRGKYLFQSQIEGNLLTKINRFLQLNTSIEKKTETLFRYWQMQTKIQLEDFQKYSWFFQVIAMCLHGSSVREILLFLQKQFTGIQENVQKLLQVPLNKTVALPKWASSCQINFPWIRLDVSKSFLDNIRCISDDVFAVKVCNSIRVNCGTKTIIQRAICFQSIQLALSLIAEYKHVNISKTLGPITFGLTILSLIHKLFLGRVPFRIPQHKVLLKSELQVLAWSGGRLTPVTFHDCWFHQIKSWSEQECNEWLSTSIL